MFVSSIGGAKKDNRQRDYLVRDFSIDGKVPVKSFPVSVNQSGAFLIGEEFLKNFTLIIDFPGKKAYFKRASRDDIDKGFKDTFGFIPMWDGKSGLIISSITTDTPASKARLNIGDKIIALNGKKMDGLTQNGFCKFMLSSEADPKSFDKQKDLKLVIRDKNGQEKTITLSK